MDKVALMFVLVAMAFTVGLIAGSGATSSRYTDTLKTCTLSHHRNSGELEQRCGELQDMTNTYFNCNAGRCWLEVEADR